MVPMGLTALMVPTARLLESSKGLNDDCEKTADADLGWLLYAPGGFHTA